MSTIKADNFEGSLPGNPIILKTNSTERMRIDTTGNVGIGTNAPSNKLHIVANSPDTPPLYIYSGFGGDDQIGSGCMGLRILAGDGSGTSTLFDIQNSSGTSTHFVVKKNSVGIGTASPAVALDVTGEARSSTSTTSSSNAKTLTTKDYVDDQGIGVGQTWQVFPRNASASGRIANTNYTNNTGKPIMVFITSPDTGGTATSGFQIDGVTMSSASYDIGSGSAAAFISFIVPNGRTYKHVGNTEAVYWAELR